MPDTIDTHVHPGQYIDGKGRAMGADDTPAQQALFKFENVTLVSADAGPLHSSAKS